MMFFWNLGKINLVIRLILIIYIVLNEFFLGGRGGGGVWKNYVL